MGKTSTAIMAGVGAGLMQFGSGLAQKYQQDQANIRVDERLAKEDAFKERELEIRESDAATRKAASDRQARFDNMKLMHLNLTKGLAGAGDNVIEQASVISKYFPDKRQYTNNPGLAQTMSGVDGKQPYMVWDVTYNEEDPGTGQLIPDPDTGGTKQVPSKSGPKIFWTKDEFTNFKSNLINPQVFSAFAAQDMTTQMAITRDAKVAAAYDETKVGIAKHAKMKSETELNIARAQAAKAASKKGPDKTSTVEGLDGKMIDLTTPDTNKLINDTKSLKEKIPGITSGEAYRFMEGMRNPNMAKGLQEVAQRVVNDPTKSAKAINDIITVYRVSKSTAMDILSEAKLGVEKKGGGLVGGLLDYFLGTDPEGVNDVGEQSLADEARDFD